jgi:hypothetical protein
VRVNATLFLGALAENLRFLGFETVRAEHLAKEINLTVGDIRGYEEFAKLHEFLKQGVPCIREVRLARFSWKEVSFNLILHGLSGCVTEAKLPFIVKSMTDDEITGEMNHQK